MIFNKEWVKKAKVNYKEYLSKYNYSIENNDSFWAEEGKRIDWIKPYTKVKDVKYSSKDVNIKWYYDGVLNVSYNCIDRHVKNDPNRIAIIWESDDPNKSEKITYRETNYKPSSLLSDVADFTILQYNVVQNNDLLAKLALGQFSSHIMEFDPLLGTFTTQEQGKFTLDDVTSESVNLGETPEVPKLLNDDTTQNLGTLPSRLITMVTDRGVLDFEPVTDKNSEPSLWQRQAYMRYQLLFTQILNMVVPLNTNLSVGDVIAIKFLKADMEAKEKDRRQSGDYMIKELCHHFDPNQSLTSMTLIRDTFGEISE